MSLNSSYIQYCYLFSILLLLRPLTISWNLAWISPNYPPSESFNTFISADFRRFFPSLTIFLIGKDLNKIQTILRVAFTKKVKLRLMFLCVCVWTKQITSISKYHFVLFFIPFPLPAFMDSYASWREASQLTCHLIPFTKTTTIHKTMDVICYDSINLPFWSLVCNWYWWTWCKASISR